MWRRGRGKGYVRTEGMELMVVVVMMKVMVVVIMMEAVAVAAAKDTTYPRCMTA
jgi:hypothetical protein